jgi:hypothetical protein
MDTEERLIAETAQANRALGASANLCRQVG